MSICARNVGQKLNAEDEASLVGKLLEENMSYAGKHDKTAHGGNALSQTGYVEGCPRCEWLKGQQPTIKPERLNDKATKWVREVIPAIQDDSV